MAGGRDDARLRAREGVQMALERFDGWRRSTEERPGEASALRAFVEAVVALSHDPQPETIERYLIASHALEDSRSRRTPRRSRAA